jgi:cysteine dioxygenase
MIGYQQILELFGAWDERDDAIPFAELVESVRDLRLDRADLAGALLFADRNYRRVVIRRRPHYEALVLCWKSGQRSPIHNHLGSSCVVKVVEGCATETRYVFSPCGKLVPET